MERSLLSLYSVLYRRGWIAILVLVSTIVGSAIYLIRTAPQYEVKARLILNDRQVGISELSRNLSEVSSYRAGESSPLATQSELIKSQRVLEPAINRINVTEIDPLAVPPSLQQVRKHLKIEIIPSTNILEVSYQNESEVLAIELLNSIAKSVVDESAQEIRQEARVVREFLEKEVPEKRQIVEQKAQSENEYRQTSGLIDVEQQTSQLVESLGNLEVQERTLVTDYEEQVARVEELRRLTGIDNPKSAYTGSRVGADQELQEIRGQLVKLEAELTLARARFTDQHPMVKSLLKQHQDLLELYQSKLSQLLPPGETLPREAITFDNLSSSLIADLITAQSQSAALENKLKTLRSERQKLADRLDQLPSKQQPLNSLVRQRQEAEETLKFLQENLEQARLAENQLLGNLRIIELANEETVNKTPSAKVVLVLATAFGIVIAISLVILLEVLDDKLHDDEDIENLLQLPILGMLPNLKDSVLNLAFLDKTQLAEPYRLLLKTLELRSLEPLNSIVISSAIASEGKSTVVAHLATVAALLGRRTLIIDANLRTPQQHLIWQQKMQPGLAEMLTSDRPLSTCVISTKIDNLDLLPCGELILPPAKLIKAAKFKPLLEEALQNYDFLIIDTPPISNCADVYDLSRNSNGLLLITRPGFTPKDRLFRSVSDLKNNGVPLIGIALNGIKLQSNLFILKSLQFGDQSQGGDRIAS